VAGLWRSNLRRSEKQERGQGQIKVLAETVQLVTVPAFSAFLRRSLKKSLHGVVG
jgi:hypothetical protein